MVVIFSNEVITIISFRKLKLSKDYIHQGDSTS